MKQWFAFTLPWVGLAHAHDVQGLAQGAHWHVTDVVGFVIAAVAVAGVWWLGRKK